MTDDDRGETLPKVLIGDFLDEVDAGKAFVERWIRRGVIASFGLGFAVPYFALLNEVAAEGDALLETLPHRNVVFLSNHQSYFLEAIAFFDLVYVRHQLDLEDPILRFSAAEETLNKNVLTSLMKLAGAVSVKRSFRQGGVDVKREVDLEGISRIEEAIREGWLLHFPAGTTRKGAPLRTGVSRILHNTKAIAVPVRVNGFRDLLLHKQLPGKLFKGCSIRIHPPMELNRFYAEPYTKESGALVLSTLESLIGDAA